MAFFSLFFRAFSLWLSYYRLPDKIFSLLFCIFIIFDSIFSVYFTFSLYFFVIFWYSLCFFVLSSKSEKIFIFRTFDFSLFFRAYLYICPVVSWVIQLSPYFFVQIIPFYLLFREKKIFIQILSVFSCSHYISLCFFVL